MNSDRRVTLNIVLVIIFILFISINIVSYLQIQNLLRANQWVLHSQKVIYLISDLWTTVLELQTSQRDYVIKNNPLYVIRYNNYIKALFERYHELDNILVPGAMRQQYLHDLLPLLQKKVTLSNQVVQTYQEKGRSEAEKLIIEHKGIYLLDQIRDLTMRIKNDEISLLKSRQQELYRITKLTNYYLMTTSAIAFILLIFLFTLMNWQYSKRKQAQKQLKEIVRGTDNAITLSSLLQSCTALEETYDPLIAYCQKILPFAAGILYLAHPSQNCMELAVAWGNPVSHGEDILSAHQCWALRRSKMHQFDNAENSIICEHVKTAQHKNPAYLCIPLRAQNDNVGLLYLELARQQLSEEQFKQLMGRYESLIMTTADVIASSLANIKLRDTLKSRSIHDALTGLYNRSYLEEVFMREILRAQRRQSKLAVIMMDIDHFKAVNDSYGHEAGDLVLVELGKLLSDRIRKSDIVCRYGGEEILLLFFDIRNAKEALHRVEEIREEISQLKFTYHGQIIGPVTASFGMAIMPDQGENQTQLIEAADQALYESKKNGRNRVTMAH